MTNLFRLCFVTFFIILSLLKGDMLLHLALSRLNNGVSGHVVQNGVCQAWRSGNLCWSGTASPSGCFEVVAKFGSLGVFIQSFLFGDTTISGGSCHFKVKFQASS